MQAAGQRARAVKSLDDTLAGLDEVGRKTLWTKLRNEVARHERFRNAAWVLPEQELAPLRSLAEKYAPTDPISAVVSLFDTWALDETADLSSGNQHRTAALQKLFADAGPEAILRLATEAKVPYSIIEAANSAGFSEPQIAKLLSLSFDRDPISSFTLGLSGLYRKVAGADRAEAWLRKVVDERGASAEVVIDLELCVYDSGEFHALAFPCRRNGVGWSDVRRNKMVLIDRPIGGRGRASGHKL